MTAKKPLEAQDIEDAVYAAVEKAGLDPREVLSVEYSAGTGIVRAQVLDHDAKKLSPLDRPRKWIEVAK
jgi:hypothetical protein